MTPPATKPNLTRLRREMETAGCTSADIGLEMQRVYSLRPREAHRHAHGWSQADAAHAYNQAEGTGASPMTAARISAYERWPVSGERPSPQVLAVMAEAYGVGLNDLLDFQDRRAMPTADRTLLGHVGAGAADQAEAPSAAASGLPGPADPGLDLTEPDRTELADAARQSAVFASRAGRTNVGPTVLEQLDADVESIATRYLREPLVPLLPDMLRLRNRAWELLEGRQYPQQSTHLYLIVGQACGLLASACSDLGQYDAADTHARAASLCADLAKHDQLRAWVASTQSLIAFWAGRIRRAADHAERAAHFAGGGTELVRAHSYDARARARLGDRDGTRAAINAATEAFDQSGDGDYIGMFDFPLANAQRCAGSALVWLGRPADGIVHLDAALHGYGSDVSYAHHAVTRLDLVVARLQLGDLDGARDAIEPVLDLPEELRLAGVFRRTEGLQRLLAAGPFSGSVMARNLAEEIEGFLERNATRALPSGTM